MTDHSESQIQDEEEDIELDQEEENMIREKFALYQKNLFDQKQVIMMMQKKKSGKIKKEQSEMIQQMQEAKGFAGNSSNHHISNNVISKKKKNKIVIGDSLSSFRSQIQADLSNSLANGNKRSSSLGRHNIFKPSNQNQLFSQNLSNKADNMPKTPRRQMSKQSKRVMTTESSSDYEQTKEQLIQNPGILSIKVKNHSKKDEFIIDIDKKKINNLNLLSAQAQLSHVDQWSAGEQDDDDSIDHDGDADGGDNQQRVDLTLTQQEIKKKAVTKVGKGKKSANSNAVSNKQSKSKKVVESKTSTQSPNKKKASKDTAAKQDKKTSSKNEQTKKQKVKNKQDKGVVSGKKQQMLIKQYNLISHDIVSASTSSSSNKKKQNPDLSQSHSKAQISQKQMKEHQIAQSATPMPSSKQTQQPAPATKKGNKKIINIAFATPKNMQEQYNLFFANDCSVNPKFEYENAQLATAYVNNFPLRDVLLDLSINILQNTLRDYGSETLFYQKDGGKMLNEWQTRQRFEEYLQALNLQDYVSLVFRDHAMSSTTVCYEKNGRAKVIIRTPIQYRDRGILSTINHEIGTHYLRKLNDKQQPWWQKRKKYEMKSSIITEEGFATTNMFLNAALDKNRRPYLFRTALIYYSAYQASRMSFVELYEHLKKYVDRPLRRWQICVRVKRGLTDTEVQGGLYKDQVYLQGVVQILTSRRFFDLRALYAGKISLQDFNKPQIQKKIKLQNLALPPFMQNYEQYLRGLDIIAKTNGIDSYALKNDIKPLIRIDIMQLLPVQQVPRSNTCQVLKQLLQIAQSQKKKDNNNNNNNNKQRESEFGLASTKS